MFFHNFFFPRYIHHIHFMFYFSYDYFILNYFIRSSFYFSFYFALMHLIFLYIFPSLFCILLFFANFFYFFHLSSPFHFLSSTCSVFNLFFHFNFHDFRLPFYSLIAISPCHVIVQKSLRSHVLYFPFFFVQFYVHLYLIKLWIKSTKIRTKTWWDVILPGDISEKRTILWTIETKKSNKISNFFLHWFYNLKKRSRICWHPRDYF